MAERIARILSSSNSIRRDALVRELSRERMILTGGGGSAARTLLSALSSKSPRDNAPTASGATSGDL